MPHRVVAALALTLWLCPKAYAPIYGTYPGLKPLIEQSDVIAAITIIKRMSEEDFGGSARYKIEFSKVLKGTPAKKQVFVELRKLEITPRAELEASPSPQAPPTIHYFGPVDSFDPFRESSRWIVFLSKKTPYKNVAYENVNCAGSTFPISPLRDLDSLNGESLPDTLILLFREYIEFKRAELKEWEKQLEAFIHDEDK
ncbi:MAG: hypothetical protein WAO00_17320 [Chthoniobacterales bacterium]